MTPLSRTPEAPGFSPTRVFGFSNALALRILLVFATASLHAQATTAGGVISGRVVDIDSGDPLAGTRVSLNAGDAARTMTASLTANTVITDTEGRFMFSGVRPGLHAIVTLTTEGNITNRPSPPSLVRLEAGEIVRDVTVRSVRSAWIKGRVTDEMGQPVVGVSVVAFSRPPNGSPSTFAAIGSSITNAAGAGVSAVTMIAFSTNDTDWFHESRRIAIATPTPDGHYELSSVGAPSLPAGEYHLAVVAGLAQDEQYNPAFLTALIPSAIKLAIGAVERKVQNVRVQ